MVKCGIIKLELKGRVYMDKQKLIALYKLLNNLMDVSDPDGGETEAIACTMQKVKEILLNRYDMFISIG